ncbi:MAG: hypothetical protein ILO53_08680 [Clostridia bacterium]|nr:hypothetical protein [Clostridia bacterium]
MRRHVFIILAIVLSVATLASLLGGCVGEPATPGETDGPSGREIPTQEPIIMRDLSNDTALSDTLLYANSVAGSITARYANAQRNAFEIINRNVRVVESNDTDGKLGIKSIENLSGGVYTTDTMNLYVVDGSGKVWRDNYSSSVGRTNTTRHGYYYWEVFQRDQEFGTPEGGSNVFAKEVPVGRYDNDWFVSADCDLSYDKGKSVTITLTGGLDPNLAIVLPEPVPKSEATHIAVTISSSDSGGRSQLFICDRKTRDFNAQQMINFEITADGKPHTYLLDISGMLTDDLTGIRFDTGKTVGEKYTFSDVKVVYLGKSVAAKSERTLDVYPDKLHQSFRLLARPGYEEVSEFGMIWEMDQSKVEAVRIRDLDGVHEDLSVNENTVQYVAFKVKDAGVIGIIIPDDSSTLKTSVTLEDGKYVVKQVAGGKLALKAGDDCRFGHRIYTDDTGRLESIDNVAWAERTPLAAESINVNTGSSGTKVRGYDRLKGYYSLTMSGINFPQAFSPSGNNKYLTSNLTVNADGADRTLYFCIRSTPGTLECAAMLDDKDMLVPMPMQVCKNFDCEKEEAIYDPQDMSFGDSIFPIVAKAGTVSTFTDIHLYMNWGIFHLKQLSSIQFFVGYYHLSTGVSESNCISFYGVFGKDGLLLPDFRGHSGIRWSTDPQFTSVASPKATSYRDNSGKLVMSEYLGSKINSSGPIYADLEYSYLSDCGSFKYTLRHTEFPQTDENRTYYTLDLTFLKDLTLNDVKNQLTIVEQDSRTQTFSELSYRDPEGNRQHAYLTVTDKRGNTYYTLDGEHGWYAYYHSNRPVIFQTETEDDPMNYAVIVKSTDFVIGGKPVECNLILRDSFANGINYSALSLDLGKTTFKKGDTIRMEFLMLPWASRDLTSDANIPIVFEDSVEKPLTVKSVATGTIMEEPYLARIQASDNKAEFTVTGGRNRNAVRVDGFDVLCRPVIEELSADGTWVPYVTNVKEYDGYGVYLNRDGSYGYAFIYEAATPDQERTFRISVQR